MRAALVCSLAAVVVLALENQASASIGLAMSDTQLQVDFAGYFGSSVVITNDPFDFSDQDYDSLASIESLSITLTVVDGDTVPRRGWDDFNNWTLGLDGVDTGLLLNGFPNSRWAAELTFTQLQVPMQDQILSGLKADGQLIATIIDATPGDNRIELCHYPHYATLTLSGVTAYDEPAPIPEPGMMTIWSLLGAGVAGLVWWRRRRTG
jgi:hypothetical protein